MQNTDGAVRRIFVKVFGFDDVERHALNTVFRLSESSLLAYALWTADAPDKPQLVLLDGDSQEASDELANPGHDALKLIWVGDSPPEHAWKAFSRPLQWSAVIEGMDQLYAPMGGPDLMLDFDISVALQPLDLDFNLDLDPDPVLPGDVEATTAPMPLESAPATVEGARVLVIDADRDARLYLRARLAMAGLMLVDEAATGAEALQLLRANGYRLLVLDLDLHDMNGWQLVREVRALKPAGMHLILTGKTVSVLDAVRAWLASARGALAKPLHPGKLKNLLQKIQVPI